MTREDFPKVFENLATLLYVNPFYFPIFRACFGNKNRPKSDQKLYDYNSDFQIICLQCGSKRRRRIQIVQNSQLHPTKKQKEQKQFLVRIMMFN